MPSEASLRYVSEVNGANDNVVQQTQHFRHTHFKQNLQSLMIAPQAPHQQQLPLTAS